MKRFITLAIIAVSVGFGFVGCSTNDNNEVQITEPVFNPNEHVLGEWRLEKEQFFDQNGVLQEEYITEIIECSNVPNLIFNEDKSLIMTEVYYNPSTGECDSYSDNNTWNIVDNTLFTILEDGTVDLEANIENTDKDTLIYWYTYTDDTIGSGEEWKYKKVFKRIK